MTGGCCETLSINPSSAGAVRNLGKRRLGAALQNHRSLLPGDVAGRHERLPRLFLVAAAKCKKAFAPKAIDFREVEADPGLVDCGNCPVEVSEPVARPTRSQQHFSRQTE